jgi:dethiobiotin synthetase/adenosylmethionine--8-amino-7-oxononanoate aminotransferase
LYNWYESPQVSETFEGFDTFLGESWSQHVGDLEKMREAARESLWWPFTQHGNVEDDSKVTLIDSAIGDNFLVVTGEKECLVREAMFDACASWWTQGLGHGESSLALASAAAAGRYGHVIFPDVVHAPALALSQRLIGPKGPGYGWASRVFFTDDGSTAMEVSIKMGFKTFQKWHGLKDLDFAGLTVCAQQDCYHGDTLGVMDVAEPSVFNEGQHPWYEPKGLFLATPTLGFADGVLSITHDGGCQGAHGHTFSSLDEAMNVEPRLVSELYSSYVASITCDWDDYESSQQHTKRTRIGSVVIEPVLMGAGGMKFVDPLWQRALMDIAKAKRVPIVFDEVASGLYRIGVCSCREILKSDPDIASYAKLLTGGLLPMSVTLASEDVFETFLGDKKGQALLHGHSYTSHPVGCVSAIQALDSYETMFDDEQDDVRLFRQSFDMDEVIAMSHLPLVEKCFALGTVLAVSIKPDESGSTGYAAASRTTPIARHLRDHGVYARPLGNVIYIMASPVTSRKECARLCRILKETLESLGEKWIV